MAASYSEKLKDPRWQRKRLEILERDGWACVSCGSKTSTLHVHHGYYARGKEPWDYPDATLYTLCEGCHRIATTYRNVIERALGLLVEHDSYIAGILFGLLLAQDNGDSVPVNDHEIARGVGLVWGLEAEAVLGATQGGLLEAGPLYDLTMPA